MKYIAPVCILFAFFTVAGCSDQQVPKPVEPTVARSTQAPTFTPEPALTATQAFTLTPSPTVYSSPTATPENFVLAESGYDIADVRFSYPREDILVVDFKYRLDESRTSKDTYISMVIPPKCKDLPYIGFLPHYLAKGLTGEGQFTFKHTLRGVCDEASLEFIMFPIGAADPYPPIYSEHVLQPYRLVRDFPTVNSDTLQVENLNFTATAGWGGLFTFDFHLSEQIPLPLEQYRFSIYGFGPDGSCPFEVYGSLLTQHNGEYMISLSLPRDFMTLYQTCLGGADKYTYTASYLALNDDLAHLSVYHQALNEQFTIFKAP